MIKIIINGEQRLVKDQLTAQQLLEDLGIADQKLALEINQEIIPRSMLSQRTIRPEDRVEIIHAIGGG